MTSWFYLPPLTIFLLSRFRALTRALADNLRSKESQDMTRKLEENIKERLGEDCQVNMLAPVL